MGQHGPGGPRRTGGLNGSPGGNAARNEVRLELADVRRLAHRALRGVIGVARGDEKDTFDAMMADHLSVGTDDLEIVEESWASYDHVNVQAGVEAWLSEPGRRHRLVGIVDYRHMEFGLAELLRPTGSDDDFGPRPGNVARFNAPIGPAGEVRQCVSCGLYLVEDDQGAAVILLRGADPSEGISSVAVEIVASQSGRASAIAGELRRLSVVHNVFRGQVVSFGSELFGERETVLRFHHRPVITRDDVILPAETLERVHRQVVGVAAHRERLLAAGQHLKRGLLLHGPPGVGKTHTVRYLMAVLTGTTIVELSGDSLVLISQACSVARTLQPAMIVVEDVDLIAENRGRFAGQHPLLFQLLNEMDGLGEDTDVVFLLTTNRADLLEPALAARPGRVDQAVHLDRPDRAARRRLFDLYMGGLSVDIARLDDVLDRTDGVTASFLKELLRRAAVLSAEATAGGPLTVTSDQLDAALAELLDTRNAMTRVLLGGHRGADADDAADGYEADGYDDPDNAEDDDWPGPGSI